MRGYVIIFLIIMASLTGRSWFGIPYDPDEQPRVAITRVNNFNTSTNFTPLELSTWIRWGGNHYDFGELDFEPDALTGPMHGSVMPFECGYPITFDVWMHKSSPINNIQYEEATLEYFVGANSGDSRDWININTISRFDEIVETGFDTVEGIEGGHFGIVTWTPPDTNNVLYLVRIWACLRNGMQSSDKNETNIGKDGGGATWGDYSVVLIKSIPQKRPGFAYKTDDHIKHEEHIRKNNWFLKLYKWIVNIFKGNKNK